jgi:hypothetical protein
MKDGFQAPADCHYMETTPIADLMALLDNTNGFKASAIINDKGGVLYSNAIDPVSRQNLGKYYQHADRLANKSGFDSCVEISSKNTDDMMVVYSSASDCLVRIRLVVLISKHSNKALMQMYLRNLLPQIIRSITWDADNLLPFFSRGATYRQLDTTSVCLPHQTKSSSTQLDLSILDD